MKHYQQDHIARFYFPDHAEQPGLKKFKNFSGWEDVYVGRHLLFSHRRTRYEASSFPEKLHSHSFYEMDIFVTGSISYVSPDQEMLPHPDDILLIPPGCQHTARLLEAGLYERYVFYFSPMFFSDLGIGAPPAFFAQEAPSFHHVRPEKLAEFRYLLQQLEYTLAFWQTDSVLTAYSLILELFFLTAHYSDVNSSRIADIPGSVRSLREYVDQHFQSIQNVADIASHFYYSREYVSRIFRQYYNMHLSEYLLNQKIGYAKGLLEEGKSVSFAFDASGFHSMSSFINAFRQRTGMTPSEYKRAHRR